MNLETEKRQTREINKLRKWFNEQRREIKEERKRLERGEPTELSPSQLIDKIIKLTDEFDRRLKEILKI